MNYKIDIEDLKCCGNCKYREGYFLNGESVERCSFPNMGRAMFSYCICPCWVFDKVKYEIRLDYVNNEDDIHGENT